jgi:hypothetical protein
VEYCSQQGDDEPKPSAAVGAELLEANRRARAELREHLAGAEQTLGELEHAAEQRMLSVADLLPDTDDVRRRAHQLSAEADVHLARAARRRSEQQRSTDGDPEHGATP